MINRCEISELVICINGDICMHVENPCKELDNPLINLKKIFAITYYINIYERPHSCGFACFESWTTIILFDEDELAGGGGGGHPASA